MFFRGNGFSVSPETFFGAFSVIREAAAAMSLCVVTLAPYCFSINSRAQNYDYCSTYGYADNTD